ncbi:AAA family ATPase [Salegentibacter sp. Hel_I_6]|uniref:AAA family ATPase n=1 Tax=Salegentibacter sp. Hel_I_6 TaxID=1250278 RepID=UPI000565DA7D|nr:AAA family ATPase [Salegentibacter sp. Hel_I_6]
MNTEQLIDRTKLIFTDLQEVNDNLYKAKLPINDKVAGIYYLNFNNKITEDDFEKLQYKYLADEFYKQEKSLQWNIYLLFINSNLTEELKIKILRDDKYGRKLVFTDTEFLDYFELEKSQQSDLPDIISTWKEELKSVGLQELYSSNSVEGILRNFKADSAKEIVEKTEKNLEHVPIVKKINSLSLQDNYRSYPLKRHFHFGKVNLFTGSNGVGKTSLMEAIEFVLTGKTLRNKKKANDGSIEAVYNDNIKDSYNHNNAYYKERGAKWYERRLSEQGNKTYESFNQFNFFNTDTASVFANSDHKNQINESLKQIILGEEYTILKDRIIKVENRLRPELNKTKEEIQRKNNNFQKNENRIDELKSEKNFEALKEDIKRNILKLGYKSSITESQYSISELYINEISNEITFLQSEDWITDFNRFTEIKQKVHNRNLLVSESKEQFNLNNKQIALLTEKNQRLKSLETKVYRLLEYFELESISRIDGLEENLSKVKLELSIIDTLKDLNNLELDILQLKNETKYLPILLEEKQDLIDKKQQLLNQEKMEVKKIEETFSTLENLTSQIKLLGKEILAHDAHTENCPLCEQQISSADLLVKLENEFKQNFDKSILNEKKSKLNETVKEIDLLQQELQSLKKYYSTVSQYLKNSEVLTFMDIDKKVKEVVEKENVVAKEKNELENLIYQLNNIEGSVSEYNVLKGELAKEFSGQEISGLESLKLLNNSLEKDRVDNSNNIEKFQNDNARIINYLNISLNLKEFMDNIENIENIVKSNQSKIDSIASSFENLKSYLSVPNDKSIDAIAKELNLLNENLKSYREIEISQREIQKLLAENEKIKNELPEIKGLNSRLVKAIKSLNKLSSNSEDAILEGYFRKNLNEIKDIYRTIHTPKEFSDIKYQDKNLVLFKENKEFQISEISTGQRAALVLSIFISLNRKLKNGPNILIFDDPVTFIDDFNALSFLDFLRYFIVKENKQIFFATANKKFSALFKKKFDFLGEGVFKEFQLER